MSASTPPPPGWAVRSDGKTTQYMLALCADTAEEAEAMAADEAQRFVVAFAYQIVDWISTGDESKRADARCEWDLLPAPKWSFKRWRSQQICLMATRQRPLPYDPRDMQQDKA